jgi:transforming growth factor-beta-induced protein
MKTQAFLSYLALAIWIPAIFIFLLGANHSKQPDRMMSKTDMDIIDTAVAAGKFNTLAAALKTADLITPLKGKGPFTVFAPTDSAFAKLPPGTLEELLKPENKDQLSNILKHHVVDEKVFLKGLRLKTLNSDELIINDLGKLTVNGSMIIVKNIPASNGVIHVIDTVLIPGKDEGKRTAMKIVSTAIELGVPLYNCKNEKACAAIYKSALDDLMEFPMNVVNSNSKKKITDVFASTSKMHDESQKAWAFRRVLDEISLDLEDERLLMQVKDVVDTAVAMGGFDTLVAAIKAADLVETLKGDGPFTVFAPTDQAFAKLPSGTFEDLLKPKNKQKLSSILTYHVVPGKVMSSEVVNLSHAKTVNGQSLMIKTSHGTAMVDNAKVIKTDIDCSNAVIHVIDTVLLPK